MLTTSVISVGMWIEDPGSLSSGNSRLLMFFVGLVAFAMVIQAAVVIAFAIGAMRSQKRLQAIAEEVRNKVVPVFDSAEALFHDTAPKLRVITDNMLETSHIVRAKAMEFDATLTDVNLKTRAQVSRVDSMMSTALSRTAALAETIHEGVRVPIKQVAGIVTGFKVGLNVLLSKAKDFGGYRPPDA
jgi:hypothetical protein